VAPISHDADDIATTPSHSAGMTRTTTARFHSNAVVSATPAVTTFWGSDGQRAYLAAAEHVSRRAEEAIVRIAMIGTRGVPARYGGFETAIEEIGSRLAARGHEVVVYCRGDDRSPEYLGMQRVRLPAVAHRVLETLSHTAFSVSHLLTRRTDVAIMFNAANAPLLPFVRAARIPVAVHVDGLEWRRAKWGPTGRRYYLVNERLAVRWADELIADARGIQDYYRTRYGAQSRFLAYGSPRVSAPDPAKLATLDLVPGGYHLVVARMEPENHVGVIVRGYLACRAELPLVVVGSVPYPSEHEAEIKRLAATDERVRMIGSVWDQDLLDSLYAGAAGYLHGHSVGGTNPSLLRAMGAGAPVIAWDVNFNREVLGDTGEFFSSPETVGELVLATEQDRAASVRRGEAGRERAATCYSWDDVALGYEQLCEDLKAGVRRTEAVLHRVPSVRRIPTARRAVAEEDLQPEQLAGQAPTEPAVRGGKPGTEPAGDQP
jgi:glycosyltransferase involved in cell wall biosynthesis